MPPKVDLILVFRSSQGKILSKPQARENARQAERQYTRLHDVLKKGGLRAVGKRGERDGQLLVLVSCPRSTLERLAQRERYSDFVSGLPMTDPTAPLDLDHSPLSAADHLRLVHTYVTATVSDGGLGIVSGSTEWDRIESVMALHDHAFNDEWIRAWTTRQLGFVQFESIKDQFGEAIALYFSFLSFYTSFLIFISAAGVWFYFFGEPYSPVYSCILLLWSITFVEAWRIRQRVLAVRWGTRGSVRVEKRRAQYVQIVWWQRDLRMLANMPVIMLFAAVLASLLTALFVFETFITHLYTGPGSRWVVYGPTIIISVVVPRFLNVYHSYAVRITNWENHGHQSTHDASLTIKTFSLSAMVDYLGLALSAFVYVPFGEEVLIFFQRTLDRNANAASPAPPWLSMLTSGSASAASAGPKARGSTRGFWEMDVMSARSKLSPTRLQDQMFASTVTNQVVNAFLEIGLPYVLRAVDSFRKGKGLLPGNHIGQNAVSAGKKKRVAFEDQPEGDATQDVRDEDKEFLECVRREVALPEYEIFQDYSEMVTQFGFVALWSTIWPLAPVMSLVNNWFELRSDAFKIAVHTRRPIPSRTDTIGPWLDSLSFLSWLAALTNSALVYLFKPIDHCKPLRTTLDSAYHATTSHSVTSRQMLLSALLIAFAASHGYIIVRVVVQHVLERLLWRGGAEEHEAERVETVVKAQYLKSYGVAEVVESDAHAEELTASVSLPRDGAEAFWTNDEGVDELIKGAKEA